jgi:hypothetical protein
MKTTHSNSATKLCNKILKINIKSKNSGPRKQKSDNTGIIRRSRAIECTNLVVKRWSLCRNRAANPGTNNFVLLYGEKDNPGYDILLNLVETDGQVFLSHLIVFRLKWFNNTLKVVVLFQIAT